MEAFTAPLSAALNTIFPRSPKGLGQSVSLPESSSDPLMKSATSLGDIHLTPDECEKADFRIEGMTCGACVEVIFFFYFEMRG